MKNKLFFGMGIATLLLMSSVLASNDNLSSKDWYPLESSWENSVNYFEDSVSIHDWSLTKKQVQIEKQILNVKSEEKKTGKDLSMVIDKLREKQDDILKDKIGVLK